MFHIDRASRTDAQAESQEREISAVMTLVLSGTRTLALPIRRRSQRRRSFESADGISPNRAVDTFH